MFTIEITEHWPDMSDSVHYISWACESGLSYPFSYVSKELGTDFSSTIAMFHKINTAGETGSFYPLANITLMPVGEYTDDQIYVQFNDAMKAQNLYIHANTVVFDLRNECYSYIDHEEWFNMIYDAYTLMKISCKVKEQDIEHWKLLCLDCGGIKSLAKNYMRRSEL